MLCYNVTTSPLGEVVFCLELRNMAGIGFIGAGNMGGAIIAGMIKGKQFNKADILVCDKNIKDDIKSLGVICCEMEVCVKSADYIVLAVKPNILPDVLKEIKKMKNYEDKTFISIAAGFKIENIEKILGNVKIIRVMPNICLKVGEGMSVLSLNGKCTPVQSDMAEKIFGSCGKVCTVKEELIDSCTAINGSGPAYVFMFMEALADAAVKHGISRDIAYLMAGQTVLGSAKLMLETNEHPGKLKDMVCSPGGTTIEACAALEEGAFRAAVISAVDACAKKAEEMSKN